MIRAPDRPDTRVDKRVNAGHERLSVPREVHGRKHSGMTLIELLIAMAVFAVISAITYGAIRSAVETQRQVEARTSRFTALQMAMAVMERDVLQMVDRSIRNEYGERIPALQSAGDDFRLMEFTRTGWQTLAGMKGMRLRRIAYALEEDRLLRLTWNVLDRAEDSLPWSSVLLTGVENVEIGYLNTDEEWVSKWPPEWMVGGGAPAAGFPRAIEIRIELTGIGWIRRLLALPEGGDGGSNSKPDSDSNPESDSKSDPESGKK
uniref:Type II secretion system protein J n=1 Tax=Candidatus Kentrum sp. FW TaxID=2126338 RepID=A0A450SFQ2_9GAMM|nr:MAG: general secretion pathway protein J [Candidatus Kentron sp. FW]